MLPNRMKNNDDKIQELIFEINIINNIISKQMIEFTVETKLPLL